MGAKRKVLKMFQAIGLVGSSLSIANWLAQSADLLDFAIGIAGVAMAFEIVKAYYKSLDSNTENTESAQEEILKVKVLNTAK